MDIIKPLVIASLTEDMFTAQAFGIGKIAEKNTRMLQEQIRQVEEAQTSSEAIKDAVRAHTGIDITPKPQTLGQRAMVGGLKVAGSLVPWGGLPGLAARVGAGTALGGGSSLLQETGMPKLAADVGALGSTILAVKKGSGALASLNSFVSKSVVEKTTVILGAEAGVATKLETGQIATKVKMPELEAHGKYLSFEEITTKIEGVLGEGRLSKNGVKYGGKDYNIRAQPKNLDSKFFAQQDEYFVVIENCQMLDKYGNRLIYDQHTNLTKRIDPNTSKKVGEFLGKPGDHPDAHIRPQDPETLIDIFEWIEKWKEKIKR